MKLANFNKNIVINFLKTSKYIKVSDVYYDKN